MGLTLSEDREINTIIKRDGSTQPYKYEKIIAAIRKAFKAVYPDLCEATIGDYTLRVSNSVSTWLHGTAKSDTVHTEEIQDVIECMLMQLNFHDVAKAFILYRSEHSKLRAGKLATDIIGTYLDKSDWRVRENSNSGYCYASLMNHVAGTMIANYCLENVYSHDVANAHIEGDIHLHDLSAGVVGYCFVGSTKIMLAQGRAKSFEELYNEQNFSPDVFSIDDTSPDCACVKPAKSVNLRMTRRVTETVTVVLANGIEVECTPDHAFMTSACPCEYTRARYLKGKTVIVTGKELYKRLFMSEYTDEAGVKHRTATEYPYIKVCDCELNDVEVVDVRFNTYDKPIPVYDLTVPTYHNFALEGGIMVHNCAGWSIRDLLMKGFIGKYGRANAGPAKHLDTALLQAANFLCTLQTEWAGAQAFNSFDTFMAPFVRKDNLDYEAVKQRVQQFVFGLNIASRYGQCVTMDVKCLKADGTVASYDELKIGDEIITFDVETGKLKTDTITHLTKKPHKGIAHKYVWAGNGTRRTQFTVTPEHRMVHRVKDKYYIAKSEDLFNTHEYLSIPEVSLYPGALSHEGKEDFIDYIGLKDYASPYMARAVDIDEDVWCPTTDTGTFVAWIDGALVIVGNCPFTNLTFDLSCPEDMKEQPVIIGGEPQDTTYGDYQKEMDMINKAFIEVMMNGDKDGRIFSFPIPTYNITEDFPWDSEVAHLLFKMTGKLGAPYFQNFINTDLSPSDVRSMCCRLRLDLTDIRKHTGGLFGAGDQTGSIGVVSINVPRIAYLADKAEDPKQEFYRLYDQRLMLAKKALEAKRREINKNFDNGLMPYSQEYLPHKFTRHFSTIGVIGFNEAVMMLLGKNMGNEESINFVKDVINYTLKKCEAFTEETGNMYNFEAVPGEGLSYRFAKIDKKKYPDIITAGTDESPYYTNSSQLPVNYTDDPFEALELQGDIQSMYSSGTVLHFYIGECIDEEEVVAKFVKNVCNKSKLPFFSLTPEFSICPKCGYIRGVHETCPNHC